MRRKRYQYKKEVLPEGYMRNPYPGKDHNRIVRIETIQAFAAIQIERIPNRFHYKFDALYRKGPKFDGKK